MSPASALGAAVVSVACAAPDRVVYWRGWGALQVAPRERKAAVPPVRALELSSITPNAAGDCILPQGNRY